MASKILVPQGLRKSMQAVLGYSQPTIRRALDGAEDTAVARRIRGYALEHGGAEVQSAEWVRVDERTWRKK